MEDFENIQKKCLEDNIIPSGELILDKLDIDSSKIKIIQPRNKRSSYRAIINWLTKYKPQENATNIEKIKGLFESFHHLCDLEDWERVQTILFIPLLTPTQEKLHNQLYTWGLYNEQDNIYETILGKISQEIDAICLNGLGCIHFVRGDFKKAFNYYQQTIEITRTIKKIKLKGVAIGGIGDIHLARGNRKRAIKFYTQQLEIAQEIKNDWIEIKALVGLGNSFSYMGEFQKATKYFLQSQQIPTEPNNKKERIKTFAGLGNIQIHLEHYDIAIEYYTQQLKNAQEIEDIAAEGDSLCSLGNCYRLIEEYQKAIEYHQISLTIAKNIGNKQLEARVIGNLGIVYHSLKKYEKAIQWYQNFIEISYKNEFKVFEAEGLLNIGISHAQLSQHTKALDNLNSSLEVFRGIDNPLGELKALISMAEIYGGLNQREEAIIYIDKALTIARKLKTPLLQTCEKIKNDLLQYKSKEKSLPFEDFLVNQIKEQNILISFFKEQLQEKYAVSNKETESQNSEIKHNLPVYNVLIITALEDELDALLSCDNNFGKSWDEYEDSLGYLYYQRIFKHTNGSNIVITATSAVDMGETQVSILATRLIADLKPKPNCLAMIGICAGNKDKVFLGDVIVADRVFKFDYGKLVAYYQEIEGQKIRTEEISRDIKTYNFKGLWKQYINKLKKSQDWIRTVQADRPKSHYHQERWLLHQLYDYHQQPDTDNRLIVEHPERRGECADWENIIDKLRKLELLKADSFELTDKGTKAVKEERFLNPDNQLYKDKLTPEVHIGVIGTTSYVREDPEMFNRLKNIGRKTLGVEMEGAAIGAVADIHEIPMIVVKSVQDYADHDKNDQFRFYAAETSARFLLEFLTKSNAVLK